MWGVAKGAAFGCEFLGPGVLSECTAGKRREALWGCAACTAQDASRFRLWCVCAERSDCRKRIGCPDVPSGASEIRFSGRAVALVGRDSVRKDVGCLRAPTLSVFRETLKTLKIKGRAWSFEKLCVYLRAFVPGCLRTQAWPRRAKAGKPIGETRPGGVSSEMATG